MAVGLDGSVVFLNGEESHGMAVGVEVEVGGPGYVVGVALVEDEDELLMTTGKGVFLRARVKDVRSIGRNAQGVSLMRLEAGDRLVAVVRLTKEEA